VPLTNTGLKLRHIIEELATSPIRKIANSAIDNKDVIPLWFGETDIITPSFISDSMKLALDNGHTFYTTNHGVPKLVETISQYSSNLHKKNISHDRIMITAAGMNALMMSAEALINPNDKVICITPVWPNFMRCIEIMGGKIIEIPLTLSEINNSWSLNMDDIKNNIGNVKGIYINSPNNPTGWMMDTKEQQEILDICRENNVWIIADEVYERIVYNRKVAPSFLDIADENDLLLVINSFSKSWAMTGWRLGWMTIPKNTLHLFEKLNEFNIASPAAPVQHAGITAIKEGENFIKDMINKLSHSRDIAIKYLSSFSRVTLPEPTAAFYTYFKVEGISNSEKFCMDTLIETSVGLAPGTSFGQGGKKWVRICYAKSPELLEEAFNKLKPILN